MSALQKIFGSTSKRELKKIAPIVDKIESLAEAYKALTDAELQAKTPEFKERYAKGESLDDLLPEAFAAAREASRRVLGLFPYRVQLIGGIILHKGKIAEMKTGEGKTLVATLPAYLNALTGEGVHIVTVNDYLARRDSEWMGKIYRFMGLTVGLIVHDLTREQRQAAYNADITYGTNNELGFDYLRDNMALFKKDLVQRGQVYAIVDEVDSILIDEARTPLIISGMGDESTQLYQIVDSFVANLKGLHIKDTDAKMDDAEAITEYLAGLYEKEGMNGEEAAAKAAEEYATIDYIVNDKERNATLTSNGVAKAEAQFNLENLSDASNSTLSHHINQAIRARGVMRKDKDYVVKDGQVLIVDEFTGRIMYGRRYNEGLHQAIEAKEHVPVARESKTLATITFQNFFRLYDKLAGMTGTAMTEEEEFGTIYDLDIVEIPTNKPVIRVDHPDEVYKTEAGKFRAIVKQIQACHEKGQPVLVGTVSIEKSEMLSKLLTKAGIPHSVLNAKHHEKEAEIIAQAGKLGAVTVATNMAGRGTDIMLGGNAEYLAKNDLRKAGFSDQLIAEATGYAETKDPDILGARNMFAKSEAHHKEVIQAEAAKVCEVGGLFILGTERHESRRIDNQLRGRAGRQGDPGESKFFLSLEDDVLRLFGSDRLTAMMDNLGIDEDTPINAKMLTKAIENAQRKVESRNFQVRKNVLDYDDVMNTQRETIYAQRREVLNGEDLSSSIQHMINGAITRAIEGHMGEQQHLTADGYKTATAPFRGLFLAPDELVYTDEELQQYTPEQLIAQLEERAETAYKAKEEQFGASLMREVERVILLRVVDEYWMENLDNMTELRQGIGLRGYGQRDPVVEYKREGYEMFQQMIMAIQDETIRRIFLARAQGTAPVERKPVARVTHESGPDDGSEPERHQPIRKGKKIGRNDPCPCGSGLKYKKCCGKNSTDD